MALVAYGFKCANEKCEKFGVEYDELLERDAEHESKCPVCKKPAQRVFSLAGFSIDFRPGFDIGLGQYVDTKAQRENICAENSFRRIKD